ncbi:MAG: MotA/TolQ/ExbB proton channel family protein [Isosphaeraceae bacterium]
MPRFGRPWIAALWIGIVVGLASPPAHGRQDEPPSDDVPASKTAKAAPKAKAKAKAVPKAEEGGNDSGVGKQSVVGLLKTANPMVWPLGLCSVVALGFALERLVALRRSRVIPRDFVDRFLDRLSGGKLDRDRALELCRADDSPMARVFAVVVGNWGQPPAQIRQAAAHETAVEVLDLRKNIRVLNATATLAPLLGLLGTVIGMIEAFEALGGAAQAGVTKGERLAHGISLALMATAAGLAIAIVSVAVYYFLLNKVDGLVRDMDDNARKAIDLVAIDNVPPIGRNPADRRGPSHHDLTRAETRTLGRSEPL